MKEWIRRIVLVICIGVFAYSSYQLIQIYLDYRQIEQGTTQLIEEYVEEPKEQEKPNPLERKVDFDKLKKQNKDIVGWLFIPDTKIDEPLFKGANNDSYLRTGIDGKPNHAGQIFLDERNKSSFKDSNTIIYGHNMKNGSRFHNLRYFGKSDYFKEHPFVYIYLPDGSINVYEIFSTKIIDAASPLYDTSIEYSSYVKEASQKARQSKTVKDEKSPLIMLSTCYDRDSDDRYVVFARLDKKVK